MTRGAVLIVKNEAATIERCLASARAAGVTVFTVVDTGSTDGTLGIGGVFNPNPDVSLWGREWVNFGHNRSEAFALARGTADWLLALDADMTVEWDDGWEPDPDVAAYMLEMGTGAFSYRLPLLLRGDLPWVSVGVTHEFTCLEDGSLGRREPTDHVRITHHGDGGTRAEKLTRDRALLEAELQRNPGDSRATFYLAQTCADQGDTATALALYKRRVDLGGWDEERAVAAYRAACLEPEWPAKQAALIAAWELRPSRLEPLYDLIHGLNARGQYHAAYAFGSAADPGTKTSDVLFLWPNVWAWGITFEYSIAAHRVGAFDEFARLTMQLVQNPRLPDHIRAQVMANLGTEWAAA